MMYYYSIDEFVIAGLTLVALGIRRVIVCWVYALWGSEGMSPRENHCVIAFIRGYLFAWYMLRLCLSGGE